MKREELAVERAEARGAVVGRWFLPEWWADALPPDRRDVSAVVLAQLAAAVAAVALVFLVCAGLVG